MSIRFNPEELARFKALCNLSGIPAATAIRWLVRKAIRTQYIPFPMPQDEDETQ